MIAEPRYGVLCSGIFLAVAVPENEAFRIARDSTRGKTAAVQRQEIPPWRRSTARGRTSMSSPCSKAERKFPSREAHKPRPGQ